MNRPESPPAIPDVQSRPDARELAIDRVGIRRLRYPIRFADPGGEPQPTIAVCSVYVALPAERKGTHMSRLVAVIDEHREPLTIDGLGGLFDEMLARLEATEGSIELEFPWFREKTAPGGGAACLHKKVVGVLGEQTGEKRNIWGTVVVRVMSLGPSSKAISDYGAHNQRSHLSISVIPRSGEAVALADLVAIAEDEASCELYGLLKRADEKYVTERAYDRPRFVEDLVRGTAARLSDDSRFAGFRVAAENFESIHNHSAYAEISRGMGSR